jgi:hypothetical protein
MSRCVTRRCEKDCKITQSRYGGETPLIVARRYGRRELEQSLLWERRIKHPVFFYDLYNMDNMLCVREYLNANLYDAPLRDNRRHVQP